MSVSPPPPHTWPRMVPPPHPPRPVVQQHPRYDHGRPRGGERGHLVAEEDNGQPDQERALGGVGNAARKKNRFHISNQKTCIYGKSYYCKKILFCGKIGVWREAHSWYLSSVILDSN